MKKVDVLFLYETKVRELENICLIKNELESRGYSVGVSNTWCEYGKKKHLYKAKVVVTHAMNNNGVYEFVRACCGKAPKIVNMQCEQIGTVGDAQSVNSRFVIKEMAHKAMNICWGEKTKERLCSLSKISSANIALTGNVALDFCNKRLRNYYKSRDEICEDYSIEKSCNINLFISSFAYVNLPDRIINDSEITDKEKFIEVSKNAFRGILGWFERLLEQTQNEIIIYRPHPAEAKNKELERLQLKYPNRFLVISEQSVKQWIIIANKVFTWYSTSAVEAYFYGIGCGILRPIRMPAEMELEVYQNAKFIESYELFLDSIQNKMHGGIDECVLSSYYYFDAEFAYVRVANTIETVLKEDRFLIDYKVADNIKGLQKIKQKLFFVGCALAKVLPKKLFSMNKFRNKEQTDEYTLQLRNKNFASEQEIQKIQKKLINVLNDMEKD